MTNDKQKKRNPTMAIAIIHRLDSWFQIRSRLII